MDLTIPVEDKILNIRVAVLLKTKDGFIFENHKKGYKFCVGGRVKIGEDSLSAAKREIQEELGIADLNLVYCTTIENFFDNVHEISAVYKCEDDLNINIDMNLFSVINLDKIEDIDIRPSGIKNVLKDSENINRNYIFKA